MFKQLLLALASTSILLTGSAHAEEPSGTALVLLTENFPPYNMAKSVPAFPTTSPCVFLGSESTSSPWRNPATVCS